LYENDLQYSELSTAQIFKSKFEEKKGEIDEIKKEIATKDKKIA